MSVLLQYFIVYTYDFLRFSFLRSICIKGNNVIRDSLQHADYIDLVNYAAKYKFNFNDSNYTIKSKIWSSLEQSLNI